MKLAPAALSVPDQNRDKFKEAFGKDYDAAAADGTIVNLASWQAANPGMGALDVEARWRKGKTVKLAPGTYVSEIDGGGGTLVVNGFYASMREKFISDEARVIPTPHSMALPQPGYTEPHTRNQGTSPPEPCMTPDTANQVHWFLVTFPEAALSWAVFRDATIGATNPEVLVLLYYSRA